MLLLFLLLLVVVVVRRRRRVTRFSAMTNRIGMLLLLLVRPNGGLDEGRFEWRRRAVLLLLLNESRVKPKIC